MSSSINRDDFNSEILAEISISYEAVESQLGIGAKLRALNTIKDITTINENFQKITKLDKDDLRNREINKLTQAGAEDGFSPNAIVLQDRITAFTATYLKAKERND